MWGQACWAFENLNFGSVISQVAGVDGLWYTEGQKYGTSVVEYKWVQLFLGNLVTTWTVKL